MATTCMNVCDGDLTCNSNSEPVYSNVDESSIPGASLRGQDPEKMNNAALKRWLKCRKGASLTGKKADLIARVKLYIEHGWDKKYLFNPDKHSQKTYTVDHVQSSGSWVQSLLDHPPPAGYSNCLDKIPVIEDSDIFQYFLIKCDGTNSTAQKHRDNGYVFYKSGKVVSSEFKMDIDDSTLIIRGDVEASFDRGTITGQCKKKYPVHIICDKFSGCILGARCVCKAGLGGYCKHVAGILFQIMDSQGRGLRFTPALSSKTSRLQTWHQPAVQGQACIKLDNLNIESFNYERDSNDRCVKYLKTDYRNFAACPQGENCVTKARIKNFSDHLSALGCASQLCEILESNDFNPVHSEKPKAPVQTVSEMHEHSENVPTLHRFEGQYTISEKSFDYYKREVEISSQEEQMRISNATSGQSSNQNWMLERKKRITASNFKSVICRKKVPYDNLIKKLTSNEPAFENRHTSWGKQAEPIALANYKCMLESQGYSVRTRNMGLIVNPNYPYLGASPDLFVTLQKDSEIIHGLVEVKSLSKNKNLTPKEAAEVEKFFSFDGDDLVLDKNHAYYYQIQGQLAICEVEWCDLVVWTPCGMATQRIFRDHSFWSLSLPKLSDFYFGHVLPALAQ